MGRDSSAKIFRVTPGAFVEVDAVVIPDSDLAVQCDSEHSWFTRTQPAIVREVHCTTTLVSVNLLQRIISCKSRVQMID